jgi:uncharacterized surface protein with fasciclin (FAS1) repeats
MIAAAGCAEDGESSLPTTVAPGAETTTTAPAETTIEEVGPLDIVGTALDAKVFGNLAGLLIDAGLEETLRGPGPFTVFAPPDEAFAAVPTETLRAVQADKDLLTTVLTYHVVPGKFMAADLQPGELETVAGLPLTVTREGDKVFVNGIEVVAADVEATNGVIHVIGGVLVPEG